MNEAKKQCRADAGLWILLIATISVAVIYWYLGNCDGLAWYKAPTDRQILIAPANQTLSASDWLAGTTAFYQNLIAYLLGIVFIILAVGFLYTHHTSMLKAKAAAEDILEEQYFKDKIDGLVRARFEELKKEGLFSELMGEKAEDIEKRLSFLEKNLDQDDVPSALNIEI